MTNVSAPPCAIPGTPLEAASAGLDLCVHCGFCLQACPTYVALNDENDSPRGRLFLMRAALDGDVAVDDPTLHTHIDRCLGCRACETACPSGVPYGHLLEATRATIAAERPMSLLARLVLATMASPIWRSIVFAFARAVRASGLTAVFARLPGRVGFAFAMLESTRSPLSQRNYRAEGSGALGRAATLDGCVMHGLFRHTNQATERTLLVNGYRVVAAPGQGCCGALHAHAGDLEAARRLARGAISTFERAQADVIVVNSAGCAAMMKDYGHLLRDDAAWSERAAAIAAKTRDITELLAGVGPKPGAPVPIQVAYDAPCHLLHGQRVNAAPITVMQAVPQLEVAPLADADQCCGGAGIYNLLQPSLSRTVLSPKLANISRSPARLVATGNPGCLMQIGAGLIRARSYVRCVHPIDLLDESYARREPADA